MYSQGCALLSKIASIMKRLPLLALILMALLLPGRLQAQLQGTVWRYQESKTEFTTLKFTSVKGGYFQFNRYERKFIFTYDYADGVGVIYRDKSEFRNNKHADRLAQAQFLIEHDTLVYDGREFVRMRGLEKSEELQPAPMADNASSANYVSGNVKQETMGGSQQPKREDTYKGTHNSGVRPARYAAVLEAHATASREAKASVSNNQSPQQQAAEPRDEPKYWAVANDISGFEDRNVVGSMPKAVYDGRDEGKNVLRVWVNRDGQVVRAEANQTGSTLTDGYFVNRAKLVASRLKLSPKSGGSITETGFLTVVFSKKQ